MNKKFSKGLYIVMFLFTVAVYANPQTGGQAPGASPLPEGPYLVLVGKMDDRLPIHVEIRRFRDNVFGRYFYENKREGKYLSLSGKVDSTGMLKLTESDGDKQTGTFTGKLSKEIVGGVWTLKFVGSWTSSTETRTLPFELAEQRFDLGGGLKIVTKEENEEVKAQKFSINSTYPQLDGSRDQRVANFNKAMSDFIAGNASKFKADFKGGQTPAGSAGPGNTLDIDYRVMYADKDLISILYTIYFYTGGAHGNTGSAAFNYDLNQGKILTLSDIFIPNANFIKAISDHCINALKQRNVSNHDWVIKGASASLNNYSSWNIVPQGLMITFDPYQVAPYAVGPQEIVIPYSTLKGMIRQDGPLASFAK